MSSPIKYPKDKMAKESQSPFLDWALRQKQSPHRHPSLFEHFTVGLVSEGIWKTDLASDSTFVHALCQMGCLVFNKRIQN